MKNLQKPTKLDAVRELVGHGISGDSNATDINYRGKTPASQSDIDAKYAEMIKAWNDNEYQRDRASQYPNIQDVVVALAEKEEGNDTMWKEITAKRTKVKSDNPKPT